MKQYGQNILANCSANISIDEVKIIYKNSKHFQTIEPIEKPLLSIVIPFYCAGYIGWLALESLIRQIGIDFKWELIIIEEDFDNPFSFKRILKYKNRLFKKGCIFIKYISINKWVPLSAKWYYLFQNCSNFSKIVCCNSADLYMSRHRLKRQYDVLSKSKYNWYKLSGNLVYDIGMDKHVKLLSMDPQRPDTCCAAMTTKLAKKLPLACVRKCVDGWRYNTLKRLGINFYYDKSDLWHDTINVNGINNISKTRPERIRGIIHPFQKCCDGLENHIPIDIVIKLKRAKQLIPKHNIIKLQSKIQL